jgi:hypothetical protein
VADARRLLTVGPGARVERLRLGLGDEISVRRSEKRFDGTTAVVRREPDLNERVQLRAAAQQDRRPRQIGRQLDGQTANGGQLEQGARVARLPEQVVELLHVR